MRSGVDLREISVFLALADELHFGRTAERCHLSSSRVSQIIGGLERKVGTPLVRRTSRRVELTAFGERFLAEVGPAYARLTEVLEHLSTIGHRSRASLRLSIFSDPTAPALIRLIKAFEDLHPDCEVRLAEDPIDDPFGPLHRGEVDLVASWLPHGQPDVVVGPYLSCEPRVLAVARDHPLTRRGSVSVEDLADHRVVRFETLPRAFHEVWIPFTTPSGRSIPHHPFDERSKGDRGRMTSELVYLLAAGKVVHPTVRSFANLCGHPDIVYIPITDLPPMRSALVWRQGPLPRRARDFLAVATDVLDGAGCAAAGTA
jgi:DNA-binding transcriptional LysR family regulator